MGEASHDPPPLPIIMSEKKKVAKKKPLRYFYYDGDLHKKIHINRSADIITAWNYPKAKIVQHSYVGVKKFGEKAFSSREVEKLISRTWRVINSAIAEGHIRAPQHTYGIDEKRNFHAYYWCEKDIMDLHAYLSTVHHGRPRKDGRVTPSRLPSAAELRAIIRQGEILYVKDDKGNFVPTWEAQRL